MRKADTNSPMWDELENFDFSTGRVYQYIFDYDITQEEDIQLLSGDSADAHTFVKELGLDYDIDSKHYSRVVDDHRVVDMVEISWKFWKN